MKRDIEKLKTIKECIKRFYLSVSDKQVAEKIGVAVGTITRMRQRMKLKKDAGVSVRLSKKEKRKLIVCKNRNGSRIESK